MLKRLIMLFVVMVVSAATFSMIHTQLTQDHTQGTSLTKHQRQLTQDKTQREHYQTQAFLTEQLTQATHIGTHLTSHQTQLSHQQMKETSWTNGTPLTHLTQEISLKRHQPQDHKIISSSAALPSSSLLALNLSSTPDHPLPRIGTYVCRDRLCSEFLTPLDWSSFNRCSKRQKYAVKWRDKPLGKCHFMNGTNRAAVALVSFPGSGNTWVRGLLEQATGVCTGAVCCDVTLKAAGFNGEHVQSGSVIVVKTHRPAPSWTESNTSVHNSRGSIRFGSSIVTVRNPFNALVAEWNRINSKTKSIVNGSSPHVRYIGRDLFGNNTEWDKFVTGRIEVWQKYFSNWILNSESRPVLVVRFEDLKTDLIGQVKRMLDFLKFPYMEDELRSTLAEGFNKFRRARGAENFEHFTPNQQKLIQSVVVNTIKMLQNHKHGLVISDYTDA